MSKYLSNLNTAQQQAVKIKEGPVLVSAPPGSGKSRIIVHRVASLIDSGVSPEKIMVATFTRKAATELKERVSGIIGNDAKLITCGTFHSICLRLLRDYADKNYRLIDEAEARNVISKLLAQEKLELKTKDVLLDISYLKAWMITPVEATVKSHTDAEKALARIYGEYEKYLRDNCLIDFDNILLEAYRMFSRNKSRLQGTFDFLLIDEYQDVNFAEGQILNFLAGRKANIFAVGDPSQAIYGFLGANLNEFKDFHKRYQGCSPVVLDLNYRSNKNIVAVSNALVKDSSSFQMRSASQEVGEKALLFASYTPEDEAERIASVIKGLEGKTAILVRASWQLSLIIDALKKNKIEFEELNDTSRSLDDLDIKECNLYLLTMHAAKGLEFDNVVVVGLEEGILPYKDTDDVSEEKRLFYVAMTRAKKKLFISVCLTRKNKPVKFSRFLDKLPKNLIERS